MGESEYINVKSRAFRAFLSECVSISVERTETMEIPVLFFCACTYANVDTTWSRLVDENDLTVERRDRSLVVFTVNLLCSIVSRSENSLDSYFGQRSCFTYKQNNFLNILCVTF